MKKPCELCLVRSCCTTRCQTYGRYVYEQKHYLLYSEDAKEKFEKMTREESIDFILTVENIALSVLGLEKANEPIEVLPGEKND